MGRAVERVKEFAGFGRTVRRDKPPRQPPDGTADPAVLVATTIATDWVELMQSHASGQSEVQTPTAGGLRCLWMMNSNT